MMRLKTLSPNNESDPHDHAVMSSLINLSLGTPFQDGRKPLLKRLASTLQCSLHTAPGQPLRPKRVRRQSLYTRLWPRLVGARHKHFTDIILSQ